MFKMTISSSVDKSFIKFKKIFKLDKKTSYSSKFKKIFKLDNKHDKKEEIMIEYIKEMTKKRESIFYFCSDTVSEPCSEQRFLSFECSFYSDVDTSETLVDDILDHYDSEDYSSEFTNDLDYIIDNFTIDMVIDRYSAYSRYAFNDKNISEYLIKTTD